jgi:gamma-glutamyltranspeptidase/glutathione hydrolase
MRDFQLPGRSAAYGENGMAATSHPTATLAALDALRTGGNALDAAVAAVAVQGVTEPAMTGIGGDCFALVGYPDGRVIAFNGSGRAPAAAAPDRLAEFGVRDLSGSVHAVTVPGAVDGWSQLVEAHGTRSLDELLQPAIRHAEEGFVVTPRVAFDWARNADLLRRSEAGRTHYLPEGRAPVPGERLQLPLLAKTLRRIARQGRSAFYEGDLAEQMLGFLKGQGGLHELEDFDRTRGAFVEPIRTSYRGVEICECPPNGQGLIALLMFNMLETFDLGRLDPEGPERQHLEIEATRLAYHDRDACLADPEQVEVPLGRLLDKAYAARLAALIDPDRAMRELPPALLPEHRDTVYLTVVDRDGMVVSFINSLFELFGSGLVCPSTGVLFHNRGKSFSLDPAHPNAIAPGKRPMHTIIPAIALKDGRPAIGFGVMGGHYQPTGQAHVLTNLLDFGMDPQSAIEASRTFGYGDQVQVEHGVPKATVAGLAARGHPVAPAAAPLGGGQMIVLDHERGVLIGGSDSRKDGLALGY